MDRYTEILNDIQQKLSVIKAQADEGDFTEVEETEEETPEMEMMEYKNDFYQMSVGSLRAIMKHSQAILEALENPTIRENLTESWLQGKIAITEDYMRTIHDFVMFVTESSVNADSYNDIYTFELGPSTMKNLDDLYGDDEENTKLNDTNAAKVHQGLQNISDKTNNIMKNINDPSTRTFLTGYGLPDTIAIMNRHVDEINDSMINVPLSDSNKTLISNEANADKNSRPGLWENIRRKKEREGKNYKPAKPGDKDRPDSDQWKKLTK